MSGPGGSGKRELSLERSGAVPHRHRGQRGVSENRQMVAEAAMETCKFFSDGCNILGAMGRKLRVRRREMLEIHARGDGNVVSWDGNMVIRDSHMVSWDSQMVSWDGNVVSWVSNMVSWDSNVVSLDSNLVSWVGNVVSWVSNMVSWDSNVVSWDGNMVSWVRGRAAGVRWEGSGWGGGRGACSKKRLEGESPGVPDAQRELAMCLCPSPPSRPPKDTAAFAPGCLRGLFE